MKHVLAIVTMLFFLASSATLVVAGPQQEKMKTCNADAGKKGLKGDERKQFMSDCLSAKGAEPESKLTPQQEKMKSCNKQAADKTLKGDERKNFMSSCLKG